MKDRIVTILQNQPIGKDIYQMVLECNDIPAVKGGQFIHISIGDNSKILRRPFCICNYDKNTITICYAIVGDGTYGLSKLACGTQLKALFPLGNGFDMSEYKKVVLLAGGMGVAVLPAIPTTWTNVEYYTILGFASKDKAILIDELKEKSKEIIITTDDGSLGNKEFCTDALAREIDRIKPDCIMVCGPEIMYKSLCKVMQNYDIPVYVSLEKRMGCGIGACLVCNCKIKTADGEKYLRACVDGPVFNLKEVSL